MLLVVGSFGGVSLVCHLFFSQRIRLFQDKALIEKIFLGSKEINWNQVISINKKSAFLLPRIKNLVFNMKNNSTIETKIPEHYFETINFFIQDFYRESELLTRKDI